MSMASLACSHASLLQHEEALKLREVVLRRHRAYLGPDHADTIQAMNNVANTYGELGRHDEALKMREEVVMLMRANAGPDHADTLWAMNNLARSYGSLKRWPDALRLHRDVLDLRRAKLAPDHPDTLISIYNVANTLLDMGRGDEAIVHFDELIRQAVGKPVNPRLVPASLERRIRYYASRDDAAACRSNAELWDKLTNGSGEFLAHAAQLWSMTSTVQARVTGPDAVRLAREDADRAMAWLTKAVVAGYKNRAELEKNKDFDALRERDDFQKLLRRLSTP
jgi:tetratricopeptide (TPR) repeat protein